MLLKIKKTIVNLDSLLIKISNEKELSKIYVWRRCVNPIDYNRLKKNFSNITAINVKEFIKTTTAISGTEIALLDKAVIRNKYLSASIRLELLIKL